jgi:uncharacterized protein with von Willebrand factor type A (vWA) domain
MSTFDYARWDGTPAGRPPAAVFDQLVDSLLEHGGSVLRRLERADAHEAAIVRLLLREGYLEADADGRYSVSPKGLRRVEDRALEELFQAAGRDRPGRHATRFAGTGEVRYEECKPYEYGDPVANLNLHETLKQAGRRRAATGSRPLPADLCAGDLVVHETEYQGGCATVLLLDMSGSMARYGKFTQAKKVALGLQALVRGRYPGDTLRVVGFCTYAVPLTEREVLRAAPKPVALFDHRIRLRVPLDRPPPGVPEHFTNIQAGLRCARHALRRDPARNRQVICVTDGEPTAHLEGNELVLSYPPGERTALATLEEVRRCAGEGIRLSTFALVEDPYYLGLRNFVEQMARQSRGVAVYGSPGRLGRFVLDSFAGGRRSRKHAR